MFELVDAANSAAVIKVIGVGGGGGNAVQHMLTANIEGVDFVSSNTDSQALKNSTAKTILQLGSNMTKGLGAGADPDIGRQAALEDLIALGAGLLITTGGMSVDPDDVTRFAIRSLGASELTYGSAALPGAMFLVAYLERAGAEGAPLKNIPVLGIPACGMYSRVTVFDLILPRVLTGERIGRRELADLGHGGLCLQCEVCRYPICPFGK